MRSLLVALLLLLRPASGQDPAAPPDPHAVLRAARQACLEVGAVRYRARYEEFGVRHAAGVTECEVVLARADRDLHPEPRFAVRGRRLFPREASPVTLQVSFDGEVVRRVRAARREVVERRFDDLGPGERAWAHAAGHLGAGGNGAVLWSLVSDRPFERELATDGIEYEGELWVDGVLCDVLYVPGDEAHACQRLFVGSADHLPRKRERIGVMYTDRISGSLLTASELRVEAVVDAAFELPVPDGFDVVQHVEPNRAEVLLAPGAEAPDWTLRDPAGAAHRLSERLGKVVVLDFWGTWCGPCVRGLPEVQELADALEEEPVEVLAVSCHEPPNARPAELMARFGCRVPLLLNGEEIVEAYGVKSFPAIYVIGRDGSVLHRALGRTEPAELEALIRRNLRSK